MFLVGKEDGKTVYKSLSFDAHQTPVFADDKKNNWVEYGTIKSVGREYKNNYPLYLVNLYNSSSTHNAILNEKTNFITGQGWVIDDNQLKLEDQLKLSKFLKHPNKSESLEDITRKIALDKKLYGGYSVEVILGKDKKISEIYHIDFGNIRRDKDDRDKFYYTSDWNNKPQKNDDFEELYSFPWDESEVVENRNYIIYIKEYRPNQKEYPLPDYVASNSYIEADYEIGNFVLNNTKNGFTAGYIANFFNGQPSQEAKTAIDKEFDNMFTGSNQAGKVLKNFSEGKEYGLELTPISANGQDDRYINLEKTITNKIFVGHQMSPALIDSVSQTSGLGNNADEKRTSIEQFQSSYVDQEQQQIEELMNSVVSYNGLPEALEIVKIKPPTTELSENTLLQIMTVDELREKAGLGQSVIETSSVADAIGSVSPLVATKILETMTVEEVRGIIGLETPREGVTKTTVTTKEDFSQEDNLISFFQDEKFGINLDELEVLKSRQVPITDLNQAFESEKNFKFISNEEKALLNLLKAEVSKDKIQKVLGISESELNNQISKLTDEGIIQDGEVVQDPVVEDELFIVYTYALRNDAPPLKTESRDFCKRMIELSQTKVFTREDINSISNDFGTDVFAFRGGWYHNPEIDKTLPYCRHIWQQELVRRR